MDIIDKIQNKSRINIEEIITFLEEELNVKTFMKKKLYYSLYATLQIILNNTNRNYIIEDMFTLWIDMTKDYWYFNRYDKEQNNYFENIENPNQSIDEYLKVKRIDRGDTKIEYRESNNETTINGITYKTGTIEYNEDILVNKYRKRLYKFRLLGKKKRW